MEWSAGMKHLVEFMVGSNAYHLVVKKNPDVVTYWYMRVVKGDWQLPYEQQEAITETMSFQDQGGDIPSLVKVRVDLLNAQLAAYFKKRASARSRDLCREARGRIDGPTDYHYGRRTANQIAPQEWG